MIIQSRLLPLQASAPVVAGSSFSRALVRLVQVSLAIYLLPALLIVLVIGSVSLLVTGVVAMISGLTAGSGLDSEARAE